MPTTDGISDEEWDVVKDFAAKIANLATQDKNDQSTVNKLLKYLDKLEGKYGRLPSILATKADYVNNSIDLLKEAYKKACLSNDAFNKTMIAESLAESYLEDLHDKKNSSYWLKILKENLEEYEDSDLKQSYKDLKTQLDD